MLDVDFLIAGVQKAGTTTLFEHLRTRPDFFLPRKELHFFDSPLADAPDGPARYNRHFRAADPGQLRGEATPLYLFYPGCLERIRRLAPAVKLVVILRDPVARAYSHYWHEVSRAWEALPFVDALARTPRPGREEIHLRRHSYLDRSCYTDQLARARAFFGPDRLKVVRLEELSRDPIPVLNEVLHFLRPAAEPFATVPRRASNESEMPRSLALQRAFARANLAVGRAIVPRRLRKANLVPRRYPPIAPEERARCRAMLLERDAGLRDLYPGM